MARTRMYNITNRTIWDQSLSIYSPPTQLHLADAIFKTSLLITTYISIQINFTVKIIPSLYYKIMQMLKQIESSFVGEKEIDGVYAEPRIQFPFRPRYGAAVC
jgi:hypothetical protein